MQSIREIAFPEIGKRRNVVKLSYAIIYLICAALLCLLTILLPMEMNYRVLMAILAFLLMMVGLLFCWLKADVKFYRPTGSLIAAGKCRISENSAALVRNFIEDNCELKNALEEEDLSYSNSQLLYMISHDRKFLAIQLHEHDEQYSLHPVTNVKVLLNEEAAIASSRLRIKIEDC